MDVFVYPGETSISYILIHSNNYFFGLSFLSEDWPTNTHSSLCCRHFLILFPLF